MADAELDTPTAAFGLVAGLMFDARPIAAYMRLSPTAEPAGRWWEQHEPVDVELPRPLQGAEHDRNRWGLPGAAVGTPGSVCGVVTAQFGVNGAYVRELASQLASGPDLAVPWPALCLVGIDRGLWVVDGNHRAAAAITAGRRTHPARVVRVEALSDCPCGWSGKPGQWLHHPCSTIKLSATGQSDVQA